MVIYRQMKGGEKIEVEKRGLYKDIKNKFDIENKGDIIDFIEDIKNKNNLYLGLKGKNDKIFSNLNIPNKRRNLSTKKMVHFLFSKYHKIFSTPLFAILYTEKSKEYLHDACIYFWSFINRTRLTGNVPIGKYAILFIEIGNHIYNGKFNKSHEIYDYIYEKDVYGDILADEQFEISLNAQPKSSDTPVKDFLIDLENSKLRGAKVVENRKTVQIEHILPKKGKLKEWDSFEKQGIMDAYIERLGNKVLIYTDHNKEARNNSFDKKKTQYEKSDFATTRKVAKKSKWTD